MNILPIYIILTVLIISGLWFFLSAVKVKDYLLSIAGIAMVGTGIFILISAVSA